MALKLLAQFEYLEDRFDQHLEEFIPRVATYGEFVDKCTGLSGVRLELRQKVNQIAGRQGLELLNVDVVDES